MDDLHRWEPGPIVARVGDSRVSGPSLALVDYVAADLLAWVRATKTVLETEQILTTETHRNEPQN